MIQITRQQIDTCAWQDCVPTLVGLMGSQSDDVSRESNGIELDPATHAQAIASRRGAVTWEVEGKPDEPAVKHFFRHLNSIWPLWAHYTALDDSMIFVATALSDGESLTLESALAFVDESVEVLRDFYAVYDVHEDLAALRTELIAYFTSRVCGRN